MFSLKKILGVFIVVGQLLFLNAAPYHGEVFEVRLPDGSLVPYKVFGDEYYADMESMDGYTLMSLNDGWLYYADIAADKTFYTSTGIKFKGGVAPVEQLRSIPHGLRLTPEAIYARAEKRRIELGNPSTQQYMERLDHEEELRRNGEIKSTDTIFGLTLLIDFPDQQSTVTQADITNYLNQVGYTGFTNNGSVFDYFNDVSGGKLLYKQIVTPFVRASQNKTYYDNNQYFRDNRYGPVAELINETLAKLQTGGFDFSKVTKNGTRFRALNVMYAGTCASEWTKGLWPHSSSISFTTSIGGSNGASYQLCDIKTQLSLGTFIHENGHLICGFADLYPYSGSETTIGSFCVMCYGGSGKNPVPPNPYFRLKKGWEDTTDISKAPVGSQFKLTSNALQSLVYVSAVDTKEMFIIDSRMKSGRNTGLADFGGIVWWINTGGSNTTPGGKKLVTMKYADNNSSGAGNCYKSGGNQRISNTTTPNAGWYDASASNMDLYFLDVAGQTMRVNISDVTTVKKVSDKIIFTGMDTHKNIISFTLPSSMYGQVNLFNLGGRLVRILGNDYYTAATRYSIPLQATSSGQYMLQFKGDGLESRIPVRIMH